MNQKNREKLFKQLSAAVELKNRIDEPYARLMKSMEEFMRLTKPYKDIGESLIQPQGQKKATTNAFYGYHKRDLENHLSATNLLSKSMEEVLKEQERMKKFMAPFEDPFASFIQFHEQEKAIANNLGRYKSSFDALFNIDSLNTILPSYPERALFEKINAAISEAVILGELQLSDKSSNNEDEEPVSDNSHEPQLIEVVTEEKFKQIERIEFLPFRILNTALKDPHILREIHPREFEKFIAYVIEQLGFENVKLTPESNDGGRDIIASISTGGIPVIYAFECKRYTNRKVGIQKARALLGTIMHTDTKANKGVLVTTSQFTSPAKRLFLTEPNLSGIDFNGIIEWIKEVEKKG